MESSRLAAALVAALLFCLGSAQAAQNPTAVKCSATLATGRMQSAILFDNDDSIYLFGGVNYLEGELTDVIKYSISRDVTELVGQLPSADYGGSAVMNKLGKIYFLAGTSVRDIHQYFPELRTFVTVARFAERNDYYATIIPDNDTALLFGGRYTPSNIISLNLNTLESGRIGGLPEAAQYPAAIWVGQNDTGYIFNQKIVQKHVRSRNTTESLSVEVPIQNFPYAAVWDGKYGYLIGQVTAGNPIQSLVQFDPETEAFALIPVEGYKPVEDARAVYIEKLDRIYMFGGYTDEEGYSDEIHYIDLSPLKF